MSLRRLTTLLVACLAFNASFASNAQQEQDSLMSVAYELVFDHPSVGLEMSQEVLSKSKALNYSRGIAESSLALAIYYRRNGDLEKALSYLNQSNLYANHLTNGKMNPGLLSWYFGEVYENIGDIEGAEKNYVQALQYYRANDKVDQEITSRILFGIYYGRRGYFEQALAEFTEALDITLEEDTTVSRTRGHLINIYNDLGMLYNLTGDYEKAKNFSNLSIQLAAQKPDNLPPSYNTLAQIYESMELTDSALVNYRNSYQLAHARKLSKYISETAQDISRLFSSLNQPDSALFYLKEAARVTEELKDARQTNQLKYSLSRFYFNTESYKIAKEFAIDGLTFFNQQRDHLMLRNSYDLLMQISERKGELEEALDYYRLYKSYSDSVITSSTDRNYSNLRIRLETMEKQKEVDKLASELTARRTQIIGLIIIGGLIIILMITYSLWIRAENHRKETDLKYSKLQQQSAEEKLRIKEQELTDFMLQMIRKNKFIDEMEEIAKEHRKSTTEKNVVFNKLIRIINRNKSADHDWDDFTRYFGQVHLGFFDNLKSVCPGLSAGELRYCALLRMDLSVKETAEIMGVDPSSVKVARYRIKKKMGLSKDVNLRSYLSTLFPPELKQAG